MAPTSLRDLAFILFKWKWDIVLVLILGAVGSVGYLWMVRDTVYQTSAKFLVKLGQEQAPPTTMRENQTLLLGQQPQHVNSEMDIIKSKDLLTHVVDVLELDAPKDPDPVPEGALGKLRYHVKAVKKSLTDVYDGFKIAVGDKRALTPREEAIMTLDLILQVDGAPDSNVFEASLLSYQSEGAAELLNAIIDEYLLFRVDVFRDQHSVDYFRKQLQQSQEQLTQAELALAEFKNANEIHELSEQKSLTLNYQEDTRQRLKTAEIRWKQAKSKADFVNGKKDVANIDFLGLGEFEEGAYVATLILDHSELTRERNGLEGAGANAQVKIKNLDRERESLANMIIDYIRSAETERRASYESLKESFDEQSQALENLTVLGNEWSNLTRQLEITEKDYRFYEAKFEEAVAVAAMQEEKIGNVVVIQRAVPPMQPLGPGRLKLLMVGMIFTGFAAVAWAAVREFFDHRVYTERELAHYTEVPVISVIPRTD